MIELSQGQSLAIDQLLDIAARAEGALELIGEPYKLEGDAAVRLHISVETRKYRQEGGMPLRDREPLMLRIHPDFPFSRPDIYFRHKRFEGYPHVNWGKYICLYQSKDEYSPADGMFGFFERLRIWMEAAGKGELDPEDAPLHPPVAYVTSQTAFVVRSDTPAIDSQGPSWHGRANLKRVRDGRFDLVGWSHVSEDWGDEHRKHPVAGAVLLSSPIGFEYPRKVNDLTTALETAGLPFAQLYSMLRIVALMTEEASPGYMVLGAPMRRRAAGEPLKQHLTVWEIGVAPMHALRELIQKGGDAEEARDELVKWLVEADVLWCTVMEDRPEIINRRDDSSPLSAVRAKRVLLLGCGALGSAVAETLVRAGVSRLHLVDNAIVHPGILVRQRYSDADIGFRKSRALKTRLDALGLPCELTADTFNLALEALPHFTLGDYDLLIDATASTQVTQRLERDLIVANLAMPLVALTISASASHGFVAVRMPNFQGGPHAVLRQSKLEMVGRHPQHPLVEAFWPRQRATKLFQPEPGCSEPTFTGSAADLDFHASALLNVAMARLGELDSKEAATDLLTAPWVSRMPLESSHLSCTFVGNETSQDRNHGYTVRVSGDAKRGISAYIKRIARIQSKYFETGGLIFGEIDDSFREIWIDSVSGPPPDSESSPEKFLCGTSGTKKLARVRSTRSGGSSRFVGIWHTHPVSIGRPSVDDLTAMLALLHGQEHPPRHVVMLIVGTSATMPVFNYYLYKRDQFQLILTETTEPEEGQ